MARTEPWHAEYIREHHVCSDCVEGQKIPIDDRIQGKGINPLCNVCAKLLRLGIC